MSSGFCLSLRLNLACKALDIGRAMGYFELFESRVSQSRRHSCRRASSPFSAFSPPNYLLQSQPSERIPVSDSGIINQSERNVAYSLGVLASGGGTNLQAILDRSDSGRLPARVAVVIGNNSRSGALARARRAGVPAFHLSGLTHPKPGALDRTIAATLRSHGVDLVVLAGYMKKLGPVTLENYRDRIVNIHPALLPAFGGLGMYGHRVHEAVVRSGAVVSGATVHLVDEEYDTGPIILQRRVRVATEDTPDSLARKVLAVEHELYTEAIGLFAEGRISVAGREVRILN